MELTRRFYNLRFPEETLRKAISIIDDLASSEGSSAEHTLNIGVGEDSWASAPSRTSSLIIQGLIESTSATSPVTLVTKFITLSILTARLFRLGVSIDIRSALL